MEKFIEKNQFCNRKYLNFSHLFGIIEIEKMIFGRECDEYSRTFASEKYVDLFI